MSSPNASASALGRLVDAYFRFLKVAIAILLMLMVVLVFGNVALRYGFNSSITVSEEVSRWFFVWMTFLGALIALREHGHIGVDALVSRFGPFGKRVCLAISQALMIYVCWLLLKGSWAQTMINMSVQAPSSGWSMGYFYGVGLVFAGTAIPLLLHDLFRTVSGRVGEHELIAVKGSDDQPHADPSESESGAAGAAKR